MAGLSPTWPVKVQRNPTKFSGHNPESQAALAQWAGTDLLRGARFDLGFVLQGSCLP